MKKKPTKKLTIAKKGLVVCYIGDGKGKTSAAMGLAVRASGAGLNVFVLQFVKAKEEPGKPRQTGEWPLSNEILFFNEVDARLRGNGRVGSISNEQVGVGFVGILGDRKEKEIHVKEALHGLERARQIIVSGKYEVVILDEIISAVELELIEERDVLDLISIKPENLHLVITGHNKYKGIIKASDLVTEMKMVKHPYYEGILAQRGIDF
jgi:cob(I)alamin adenosyltransferase